MLSSKPLTLTSELWTRTPRYKTGWPRRKSVHNSSQLCQQPNNALIMFDDSRKKSATRKWRVPRYEGRAITGTKPWCRTYAYFPSRERVTLVVQYNRARCSARHVGSHRHHVFVSLQLGRNPVTRAWSSCQRQTRLFTPHLGCWIWSWRGWRNSRTFAVWLDDAAAGGDEAADNDKWCDGELMNISRTKYLGPSRKFPKFPKSANDLCRSRGFRLGSR
jgi:hypothetical protein